MIDLCPSCCELAVFVIGCWIAIDGIARDGLASKPAS